MSRRELAAVLAGLRLLQREIQDANMSLNNLPEDIEAIISDGGEIIPMDCFEIGNLCARLNA